MQDPRGDGKKRLLDFFMVAAPATALDHPAIVTELVGPELPTPLMDAVREQERREAERN